VNAWPGDGKRKGNQGGGDSQRATVRERTKEKRDSKGKKGTGQALSYLKTFDYALKDVPWQKPRKVAMRQEKKKT